MNKMCGDCKMKYPSYGMPAEKTKRWCKGCATNHPGAVTKKWKIVQQPQQQPQQQQNLFSPGSMEGQQFPPDGWSCLWESLKHHQAATCTLCIAEAVRAAAAETAPPGGGGATAAASPSGPMAVAKVSSDSPVPTSAGAAADTEAKPGMAIDS